MFSLQDLRKLPDVEIGEADNLEEVAFKISTLHVGDLASEWMTLEVQCQCVQGNLILSRARVNRAGGGEVPECWMAQNIEQMLLSLIQIQTIEREIVDEAARRERRESTLKSRSELAKSSIDAAAAAFISAGAEYFRGPMDQLSEFMAICSNAFAAAATKINDTTTEQEEAGGGSPGEGREGRDGS